MSHKLREILRESKCRREVSGGSMTLQEVDVWEPGQDVDIGRERGSSFTKGTICLPLQELPEDMPPTCILCPSKSQAEKQSKQWYQRELQGYFSGSNSSPRTILGSGQTAPTSLRGS